MADSPVQAPTPTEYEIVGLKQQPLIDPVTGAVLRNPAQEPAPKPGGGTQAPAPQPQPAPEPQPQPQPQPQQ